LSRFGRRPALDVGEFRERVVAAVLANHPGATFERPDEQGLLVTIDDAGPWTVNCERMHALYLETPEELDGLVRQLAASVGLEPPAASTEALKVLVRPASYLMPADDVGAQLSRQITRELRAIVAVDSPTAIHFPDAATLQRDLGLDATAIWSIALENTRRCLPQPELPPPKEISLIICDEGEASGLLALDDEWRRLDEKATAGILVLAAEKNVVCILSEFSREAIPALDEILAVANASPEYLSSTPLTRRDGRWIEAEAVDPAFGHGGTRH
jgi:hypothetical protein